MTESSAKTTIEDIVKDRVTDFKIISARRRRSNALKDDVYFLVIVPEGENRTLYKELRDLECTTRKITTLSSDVARDEKSGLMVEHFLVKATVER